MLKILQARLQQYVNQELSDVQAGFRKGIGTRDQITNVRWIKEKAWEVQNNFYFCFIYYSKAFDCVYHNKLENSSRDGNTRSPDLPPRASLIAQLVKNPPAMWETWVRSLGWEDPLEKGKDIHSSILAWRIP